MTKAKRHAKRTPPDHLVIVDTGILWHSDKAHVVSPEFESVWLELDEIADLTLAVPEVVRGELLFQQTSSAFRTMTRVRTELAALSATTGVMYSFDTAEDVLAKNVETRLDSWLDSRNARVLATPVGTIDWKDVIDAAIWRKPPFTLDKSANVEKGFRDSLILETVLSTLRVSGAVRVAFLCSDRLLAETAVGRADGKLIVHDSVTAFASYLRLTQETLTEQFVASVVDGAAHFFFEKKQQSTLYYVATIRDRIEKDFAASMEVDEFGASFLHSLAPDTSPSPWVQVGPQRVRIAKPQFLRIADNDVFYWRSSVALVRGYQRERPKNDFSRVFGTYDQNVLILRIDVDWHAKVDSDGKFSEGEVDTLSEGEREFRSATKELITKYDLKDLSLGLFG